ncbi:DUF4352 domain-containing protein [Streptomyces sp. NPDC087300]|uniref:DUF4352 domain-containing protein n=1 Tax=Streptomyces sp. NPDC087300 TaxID=3365780 RepID=UPI00382D2600
MRTARTAGTARTARTTRVRTVAAAVLALGALTGLTACVGGDDEVSTKPKPTASSDENKADGAKADEKKADEDGTTEKPVVDAEKQEVAKVGDTIELTGMDKGSKLDVTVVKVADNAKSSDEFTAPESGKRWLAVQFQLVNTGTKPYADSPQNGAQLADSQGQQFQTTFADITAGPSMSSDVKLRPGAKALGWITFELPKASKADVVQFAMDSGFSDKTGEWKLK